MTVPPTGSTVVPPDDVVQAMHVFIHDLRSPVSVAVGYLRLLREGRLPDDAAQKAVIAQTLESLGRVSVLCDEASTFLAALESAPPAAGGCPVNQLVAALVAQLRALPVDVEVEPSASGTPYVAVLSADRMAERLACLASLSKRLAPQGGSAVRLTWDDECLRMVVGTPPQHLALGSSPPAQLDAWRGGLGLRAAAACLEVERHGGRVWTAAEAWPGLAATLPLMAGPL